MNQNPLSKPTNQPDSYKTLLVFRKSECVYDITFYFVSRIANIALIVIHQTLAMLRGLIDYQNRKFLEEGGVKEQRYKARVDWRNGKR